MAPLPPSSPHPDRLCLTCTPFGEYPTTATEPTCFELTPALTSGKSDSVSGTATGEYMSLYAEVPYTPDSLLLTAAWDQIGAPLPSRLYRIERAGQPVSTETIRDLCGGQAPFLWRPKTVEVHPDTDLSTPFDSASLFTTDGAVYGLDRRESLLPMETSRLAIPGFVALEVHFQKMWSQQFDLLVGADTQQCPVETTPPPLSAEAEPLSPLPFGHPSTIEDGVDELVCGDTAPNGPEVAQLRHDHALVSALDDPTGSVPTQIEHHTYDGIYRWAETDTESGEIKFFHGLLNDPLYQAADPMAQQFMRRTVLAHERGHNHLDRVANALTRDAHSYAAYYGLPVTAAASLERFLERQGWVSENLLAGGQSISLAVGGTPGANALDIPSVSELMAYLYETQFLAAAGLSHWSPELEEFSLTPFAALTQIASTLVYHYSMCLDCVGELNDLHALIVFNPQFTDYTKISGLHFLYDVVRQLPYQAQSILMGEGERCRTPAGEAGLSAGEPAPLEDAAASEKPVFEECDLITALLRISKFYRMVAKFQQRQGKRH